MNKPAGLLCLAASLVLGAGALTIRPTLLFAQPPKSASSALAADAPLSLTASDGSGLELVALDAQIAVDAPLAFTELRLTFTNPENRVREGRFRITLPQGAVVSRFAMKIGDRFQEGEVVELKAAREAYEDFLHRRQDPALLESEAGNEFSARVFPIPAHGRKELIVSYSQELPNAGVGYRLPLRGLPRIGSLTIRAQANAGPADAPVVSNLGGRTTKRAVIEVDKKDFTPDRDFEVPPAPVGHSGLRHENLVVARVAPLGGQALPYQLRNVFVLVDTSASRALGFAGELDRVRAALDATNAANVTIAAFDQTADIVYSGPARGAAAGFEALRKRRALGASDLSAALSLVASQPHGSSRVLLVADGVATAGVTATDRLRAQVAALAKVGVQRLDVLAAGGIRDDERLARLATAGLPHAGLVIAPTAAPSEVARKLNAATRSGLAVSVPGAAWVWPARLDGVQPGDELLVYADLPAGTPFELKIDGRTVATDKVLSSAERPLLERAWVKARIARLTAERDSLHAPDVDVSEALRHQIIALSTQHRVLSPFTALLVLETEDDYRRFAIDRRALADILTIGPAGVTVQSRRDVTALVAQGAPIRVEEGRDERRADKKDVQGRLASASELQKRKEEAPGTGARGGAPVAAMARVEAKAVAAPPPAAAEPRAAPRPEAASEEKSAPSGLGALAARGNAAAPDDALAGASERDREGSTRTRPVLASRTREHAIVAQPAPKQEAPYEGKLAEVMDLLARSKTADAKARAWALRDHDAGDVLALVALGEAGEASRDLVLAARAYGSIIDLFPGRADLRRFAGARLERVRNTAALALAIDTYRKAVEQRPDHPASHRLLAYALAKAGRFAEAFAAIEVGATRRYPDGRFAGATRVLSEDLGLLGAAWASKDPAQAGIIRARLARAGAQIAVGPSLRFVLTWETDANDVDFHIYDGRGGHASYSSKHLPSGGDLYADVTTGYGPECFTVPGAARAFPYKLQAHYYSRGPMGYGMGKLQIVEHDGHGGLKFDERPFVVMRDGAYVDLGVVRGPLSGAAPALARGVLSPLAQ